jgi:hypothetical protein
MYACFLVPWQFLIFLGKKEKKRFAAAKSSFFPVLSCQLLASV